MNDIAPGAGQPVYAGSLTPDPSLAAFTRQLSRAVQTLNHASVLPHPQELAIFFDAKTKVPVVRVVDAVTHEVLNQFPADYILRITAFLESETRERGAVQTAAK